MSQDQSFPTNSNKQELEHGNQFTPNFDGRGLITAIASDWQTGEILMVAYMNEEALRKTLSTGKVHYWSRSRQNLWLKGETSSNVQYVKEIRTDCDQDVLWIKVEMQGHGAACHTGRTSCFYRYIDPNQIATEQPPQDIKLITDIQTPRFDPDEVYKSASSQTDD